MTGHSRRFSSQGSPMPEYEVTYRGPGMTGPGPQPVLVEATTPDDAVYQFNREIGGVTGEYEGERYLVNDVDADERVVVSIVHDSFVVEPA